MRKTAGHVLVVLAGLVLAMSFAGDLHGLGDSLAVFRPVLFVGCLLVSALVWRWRVAQFLAVAAGLVAFWHWGGGWLHEGPKQGADVAVYQKNMLFLPRDRAPLEADIRASSADFVTLQEVSRVNVPMLEVLRDLYPHQLLCNAHSVGAVAILSKTELRGEDCGTRSGIASAVTQIGARDVHVISVHLHWPWPYAQRQHAIDLIANLAPIEGGVTLVGGDFNMVASGRSLAWFEAATGTARVGPNLRTFDLFGYPLGIDHILATGGTGVLSVRPQLGSDHFGLLASIEFP